MTIYTKQQTITIKNHTFIVVLFQLLDSIPIRIEILYLYKGPYAKDHSIPQTLVYCPPNKLKGWYFEDRGKEVNQYEYALISEQDVVYQLANKYLQNLTTETILS